MSGEEQTTEVKQPEDTSTSESTESSVDSQQTPLNTEQEAQAQPEIPTEPTSPEPQPGQQEVDDLGVPWKNRYMESQKKLDKVTDQLNAVADRLDKSQGQRQEKYSIEELESFAETTDDPRHRAWAKGEIRRLEKEEVRNEMKSVFSEHEAKQQAEQMKSQALQTVMTRYPDAFKKDAQGRITGWDQNSPLAQRIGQYMQDKEIASNPRGLLVASALAFSDVAPTLMAQTAQKAVQAKSEAKSLQKQTLTEGGGVSSPPQPKTPVSAAKDKLSQTGSIKDGAAVFKEVLKNRGRIKED